MINEALSIFLSYLANNFKEEERELIIKEFNELIKIDESLYPIKEKAYSYLETQDLLSKLNEKESIRKKKGVYYTPIDVVNFVLSNSIKSLYGKLDSDNVGSNDLGQIPYKSFCTKKKIFDPTCGAGEFLIEALKIKLDMLEKKNKSINNKTLIDTISTIYGNDINMESVLITKLRLFLSIVNRYEAIKCIGISEVLNKNFKSYDFITNPSSDEEFYHIIVGNPPFVEDYKSGLNLNEKFGNIYANVLKNATNHLEKNGVIGFIVPLSYNSTPRMQKIRDHLSENLKEQYILSFADRPDCLFNSVHQKLCILIGKQKAKKKVFTSNYQFWYKEERNELFKNIKVIENKYSGDLIIPKLGNKIDHTIYEKIMNSSKFISLYSISRVGNESVYINRRETFWIKAYRTPIIDPEYKVFSFNTPEEADYCYCLVNSSLFWWYWIATSDCWHVSKELNGFKVPQISNHKKASELAKQLISKLEETKIYVGTKQTEYEYKHKDCLDEIHEIDNYINNLFGLSEEENAYIKNFAHRYRASKGAKN